MKVAVLSESSADEAAIRVFVEAILGSPTERPDMPKLRTRGLSGVLNRVRPVLRYLHYRTDAEALVLVVDSDRTPVHDPDSENRPFCHKDCRLCQLYEIARETLSQLADRQPYPPLRLAIGLAAPQIEAWYLVGRNPGVSEASWINAIKQGQPPYDSGNLKRQVYGTDRPPIDLETTRAVEESRRIVNDGLLARLMKLFPGGFGTLAESVRNW